MQLSQSGSLRNANRAQLFVQPGNESIAGVQPAAFDEVDAVRIKVGDEALVRLDAYPDVPLNATVERVDPVVGGDSLGGESSSMLPIAGKKDSRSASGWHWARRRRRRCGSWSA